MKNNLLTIGRMAKLNNTTLATLRLYDKKGLLKPSDVDPDNKYRIYNVLQSAVFHMIQHNKDLNLTLREIKEILDHSNVDFLANFYRQKLDELNQKVKEIQWQQDQIRNVLVWIDYFSNHPPVGAFVLEYIRPCYTYTKPAMRDYLHEDFGSVIYDLSHMEGELRNRGIRGVYPYHAFLSMSLEDFESGRYKATQIGVILDEENATKVKTERRKSTTSACVYVDGFEKVRSYMDQLKDYCKREHCTLIGDFTCQIIGVIDPHDFRKTKEILRLQVPIQKEAESTCIPFYQMHVESDR